VWARFLIWASFDMLMTDRTTGLVSLTFPIIKSSLIFLPELNTESTIEFLLKIFIESYKVKFLSGSIEKFPDVTIFEFAADFNIDPLDALAKELLRSGIIASYWIDSMPLNGYEVGLESINAKAVDVDGYSNLSDNWKGSRSIMSSICMSFLTFLGLIVT
jgi:hypothetical protein